MNISFMVGEPMDLDIRGNKSKEGIDSVYYLRDFAGTVSRQNEKFAVPLPQMFIKVISSTCEVMVMIKIIAGILFLFHRIAE